MMNFEMEELLEYWQNHRLLICSVVGTGVGLFALRRYFIGGVCRSKAKLDGKTVIITGANTGIGRETAKDLAGRGARVILACRDITKAERTAADIIKTTQNDNVVVRKLDLASMASIRKFADKIIETEEDVNILINNAGIMMCPEWKTEDGFEMQFGVNHLGHFLLTNLLLDKIKKSAPARIVNVSSKAHEQGKLNFDDLNSQKSYNSMKAYRDSKLANVLFTRELSRRLAGTGVTVNSLHPGIVMTELGRHFVGPVLRVLLSPTRIVVKTAQQGAQTSINCAVSEDLEGVTGKYFSDCAVKREAEAAQSDEDAKRLWEMSEEMVRLKSH